KNKLREYDPNKLLLTTLNHPYGYSEDILFEKILIVVSRDPRLDCEEMYCGCNGHSNEEYLMKEEIKSSYSTGKYKKFCLEHIGEWSGSESESSCATCNDDSPYEIFINQQHYVRNYKYSK